MATLWGLLEELSWGAADSGTGVAHSGLLPCIPDDEEQSLLLVYMLYMIVPFRINRVLSKDYSGQGLFNERQTHEE